MSPTGIKVEHINPFIKACLDTFSMMADLNLTPGRPTLKKHNLDKYDISGIIGLSGEAVGSIALCFSKKVVLQVVSRFVGSNFNDMNRDVADAVGELANIIAGYAKKGLIDLKVEISLPSVIMGGGHRVFEPKDAMSFIIPFDSFLGSFDMDVTLKRNPA